jgi:type I restriction enzyme S subunit
MSDELPEGWTTAALPSLGSWGAGGTPLRTRAEYYERGNIPWLKIGDLNDGMVTEAAECITHLGLESSSAKLLPPGTLLIAMYGSIGKLGITGIRCATNQAIAFCKPDIDLKYLFWTLRWKRDALLALGKGGTQANISQAVLREVEVPVAPFVEQCRIVAKVEELLAEVNRAKARLTKVQAILKRFRQSVLAAACSGELTREWRSAFLAADGEWGSSVVERVCTRIVDCPHSTPQWSDTGEICLRTTNFFVTGLNLREVRRVSRETYAQRISRLAPEPGDVVYSREGGILGIACEIPDGLKTCLGQRMMLMRPDVARVRAGFLCLVLNSPSTLVTVRELTGGTAAPHLNVGDIKQFVVPLPSVAEQDQILLQVKQLFGLADLIESRLALAAARADKLPQAILSKAFAGDVVPTEAELARLEGRDYEPASVLLERLENTSATAKLKTKKRSTKRE